MYQIDGSYDFVAKMMRKSGYPYLITQKCDKDSVKTCEEAFVASQEEGKQLIKKNEEFNE